MALLLMDGTFKPATLKIGKCFMKFGKNELTVHSNTFGEHSSKYISDQMNSALFLESKKRSNYFRFLACSNQQHLVNILTNVGPNGLLHPSVVSL
jgi:hypothetical protein